MFNEGYVIRNQNVAHFLTFTVCRCIDISVLSKGCAFVSSMLFIEFVYDKK